MSLKPFVCRCVSARTGDWLHYYCRSVVLWVHVAVTSVICFVSACGIHVFAHMQVVRCYNCHVFAHMQLVDCIVHALNSLCVDLCESTRVSQTVCV